MAARGVVHHAGERHLTVFSEVKQLTAGVLAAFAAMLIGCSPDQPPAARESVAEIGQRLFNGNCVACHQLNGLGLPGVYPTLSRSPVVNGDAGDLVRWVITGVRPAGMPPGRFSTVMPQFGWLKPKDAAALATYLRSNFGNTAPAVDAAVVENALNR